MKQAKWIRKAPNWKYAVKSMDTLYFKKEEDAIDYIKELLYYHYKPEEIKLKKRKWEEVNWTKIVEKRK